MGKVEIRLNPLRAIIFIILETDSFELSTNQYGSRCIPIFGSSISLSFRHLNFSLLSAEHSWI